MGGKEMFIISRIILFNLLIVIHCITILPPQITLVKMQKINPINPLFPKIKKQNNRHSKSAWSFFSII
ncbi:hypothetical protein D4R86_03450 [bacterium]|nr:MAG: hypothetical protein D4R86_03450 [bacterium]